jgi:hypothetical protein
MFQNRLFHNAIKRLASSAIKPIDYMVFVTLDSLEQCLGQLTDTPDSLERRIGSPVIGDALHIGLGAIQTAAVDDPIRPPANRPLGGRA